MDLQKTDLKGVGGSQNGEDEIVLRLVPLIGSPENWKVCEFGASTGRDNSNCLLLVERGAKGIFIEGDPKRFRKLTAFTAERDDKDAFLIYNEWVSPETDSPASLSSLLFKSGFGKTGITVVSIDVDGDDFAHMKALDFSPEVIICEYNPTFPHDSVFVNPLGKNWGNSAAALNELAQEMGYFLGCVTETNLIFLREVTFGGKVVKQDLDKVFIDRSSHVRLALAYDGTLIRFNRTGENKTREIMDSGWSKSFIYQGTPFFTRSVAGSSKLSTMVRRGVAILVLLLPRVDLVLATLRRR